ncbi:MAG: transglutaminase family protein [Nigerium sp.]|nr:transglutaminase family protein [Nigerium sp.]
MTIRVALEHRTTYTFDHPVEVYPHTVRLRPAPHSRTPIAAYSLNVSPSNHFINWQQDPFGNYLARIVFPELVSELDITVDVVADMTVINPFDFFVEEYAERFPFVYPPELRADLEPYLRPVDEGEPGSGPGALARAWVRRTIAAGPQGAEPLRIVDFLVAVNTQLQHDIAYTVRMEPGVQTPDTTLGNALGSCRDSAWLLVSILRQAGLAARFVSGYLVQLTADIAALDGPSGPAADFTDLHAWTEVFIPGAGWVGLDPTSGLFAGEGHIPLSATPHPSSAAPITGATAPVAVSMAFSNTVRRIHEDPRVTKPYSDEQWAAADDLGARIDTILDAGDVRLTMGGEPTFVSAADTSTPQWQSAADGPEKRRLAHDLTERLAERWASGGVIHHGQGKWYPGEDLPRWNIAITWRTDGVPIWENPALLANPWDSPVVASGTAEARAAVRELAQRIAAGLGIPGRHVVPAYEDAFNDLLTEAQRPSGAQRPETDLDPGGQALADPERRAEAVATFDTRRGEPRGCVVPVFRLADEGRWGTALWRPRRRHVFLTPGTSPMGLRLPLSSLSWHEPPIEPERSPLEMAGLLPLIVDGEAPDAVVQDIADSPRSALCVEEREGRLSVFLPPLEKLEDALELLSVVETSAAAVGLPVVLEGYPLPFDLRVKTLSVTPDPGVIEVNTQPTSTWAEQRDLTLSLYADARQARLATEKFDVDGTHTGTGGGNHFTLGGATPIDSPLLRRPDLLRSLLTYWQHHPSLSYVFSGRFIGPTSQAPRVDEGRHETLYELEIAFAELDRVTADAEKFARPGGGPALPWNADRLLRHLLTDLTGNTHRAEFCIDKLYSPDSQRGRLGLLELRGFEMPPHARMALVQALLVRSLVARFWDEPYRGRLIRWGSRLHDRFLLPAFAAADLREVVADVNGWLAGRPEAGDTRFDEAWLDPFLEFRFPRLGETRVGGVHVELRQAIEPWHVLGEETTAGGTARYVDSSVERVQVAASGLVEGRHVLTCNGVPIPMTAVEHGGWGTALGSSARGSSAPGSSESPAAVGMFVGGVRYRAWAPWSALHPTMGVHSPLTFDLVDTWNSRSLGGFTYHVVHPGGRNYDTFPVNAVEAESRRAARFEEHGHSPGTLDMSAWPAAESVFGPMGTEYPCTLDLRRYSPGSAT